MLRRFAGAKRRPNEAYVEWIVRATRFAEDNRNSSGVKSWNEAILCKKWSWAGHVARLNAHRWAQRLSKWRDHEWWQSQDQSTSAIRPKRAREGHFARWETEVTNCAAHLDWSSSSQKAGTMTTLEWNARCKEFAAFAGRSLRKRVD